MDNGKADPAKVAAGIALIDFLDRGYRDSIQLSRLCRYAGLPDWERAAMDIGIEFSRWQRELIRGIQERARTSITPGATE